MNTKAARPGTPPAAEIPAEFLEMAGELRLAMSRIGRRTRAGLGSLTPSQLSALTTLEESGPLRLNELASREGVAAPTMSRVVDALAQKGFIERERDPRDARSWFASISDAGRRGLARTADSRTTLLAAHLAQLDDAEAAALSAALPALRALAETFYARDPDG